MTISKSRVIQNKFNGAHVCRLGGEIFFPAQFGKFAYPYKIEVDRAV